MNTRKFPRPKRALALLLFVSASAAACEVEGDDVDALPPDECGEAGCGGAGGGTGGVAGGAMPGGDVGGAATDDTPTIDVIWEGGGGPTPNDEDSVTVAIDDGPGTHTYQFGLAETGSPNGWFGEDCLPGDMNGADVCHEVGDEGGVIDSVAAPPMVRSGQTLLWAAADEARELTYVIIQKDTQACWTFGHDPTYYTESVLGCVAYNSP